MPPLNEKDQRLWKFIQQFGVNPHSSRLYLTTDEIFRLMEVHKYITANVTVDLACKTHIGKWTRAIEGQIKAGGDPSEWMFWMNTRQAYLEMGGEYKLDLQPPRVELSFTKEAEDGR